MIVTTDQRYPDVTDVDMTYADVTERLFLDSSRRCTRCR